LKSNTLTKPPHIFVCNGLYVLSLIMMFTTEIITMRIRILLMAFKNNYLVDSGPYRGVRNTQPYLAKSSFDYKKYQQK